MPRRIPRNWINRAYESLTSRGRPSPEQLEAPPADPTPEVSAPDAPVAEPRPDMPTVERPAEPAREEPVGGVQNTGETLLDPAEAGAARLDPSGVEQRIDAAASAAEAADTGGVPNEVLRGRRPPVRNINLDFFEDSHTRAVLEMYNRVEGVADENFEGRRVVSHRETLSRAAGPDAGEMESIAMMRKILAGDINEKWSPEELVTAYRMLEFQGADLREMAVALAAKRREGADLSTEDLAQYKLLETRFVALMEIVSTRASEAGRLLNSLNAIRTESARGYAQQLKDIVQGGGGRQMINERIDLMSMVNPNDVEGMAKMARDTFAARTWDMLIRVRYSLMLSSIRTHAANILGSSAAMVYETVLINPVRVGVNNMEYLARAAGQLFFGRGAMAPEDRMLLGEAISVGYNTMASLSEALTVAYRVAKGEALGFGKIMNENGMRVDRVFSTDIPSIGGFVLDTPTRFIEAEDAFFRTMHINAKVRQLAKRRAVVLGRDRAETNEIYNNLVRNPTEDIQQAAYDYAAELTFTSDPSIYGSLIGGVAKAATTLQDTPFGRVLLPFVRTPANLSGYSLRAMGLEGFVAPKMFVQKLTSDSPEVRADAVARVVIAAGLFMYTQHLYEEGIITGARPRNNALARAREAAGWRPNSIKIGGEYYELNRIDPFGLVIGAMATVHDTFDYLGEENFATKGAASLIAVASLIKDRSMLTGFAELADVLSSSEYTGPQRAGVWGGRVGVSFVFPTFVRDFRQMGDEYQRSQVTPEDTAGAFVQGFTNAIVNGVPGLSDQLPPAVNAFGEDQVMGGHPLWRAFVPLNRTEVVDDRVGQAWIALGISMPLPDRRMRLPGVIPEIDLMAIDGHQGWVYREYVKFVQKSKYAATEMFLESNAFQRAIEEQDFGPNSNTALGLQRVLSEAGQAGKLEFFRWLEGRTSFEPVVGGERIGRRITIEPVNREVLEHFDRMLRGQEPTKETMEEVREHPGIFFRPRRGVGALPEELTLEEMRPQTETPRQPVQRPEF